MSNEDFSEEKTGINNMIVNNDDCNEESKTGQRAREFCWEGKAQVLIYLLLRKSFQKQHPSRGFNNTMWGSTGRSEEGYCRQREKRVGRASGRKQTGSVTRVKGEGRVRPGVESREEARSWSRTCRSTAFILNMRESH